MTDRVLWLLADLADLVELIDGHEASLCLGDGTFKLCRDSVDEFGEVEQDENLETKSGISSQWSSNESCIVLCDWYSGCE